MQRKIGVFDGVDSFLRMVIRLYGLTAIRRKPGMISLP